jgi:hypothetical protein
VSRGLAEIVATGVGVEAGVADIEHPASDTPRAMVSAAAAINLARVFFMISPSGSYSAT